MTHFSTTYKGYTVTLIGCEWRIAGYPALLFTSQQSAQTFIDRLITKK